MTNDSGVERVRSTDPHGESFDRRRTLRGATTTAGAPAASRREKIVDRDEMELGRLWRTGVSVFVSQRICGGAEGFEYVRARIGEAVDETGTDMGESAIGEGGA